ncbi:Trm112 family protein [Rhodococcus rhodnii]|uniref:UPF0434 protein Rrhod_0020 n=2 Tax=Rhodococcus rhodnii TaxID=38312 RepID=R7WWG7_9NOCA|nr:Trm112 family protein [Rhodococcus rhodnii]EOM78484.1 hypothetical protein Rrhod_0020 [Rhodococcus rhodnii LMG 5362]TXG91283.1 Trm112 family protein [Rhodococcus rhodnii]
MVIDPTLLGILACPQDKGPLVLVDTDSGQGLYNPRLQRLYPIENDIPVLLVDEARDVADDEHARLIAQADG